jgi:hypothetical protein
LGIDERGEEAADEKSFGLHVDEESFKIEV